MTTEAEIEVRERFQNARCVRWGKRFWTIWDGDRPALLGGHIGHPMKTKKEAWEVTRAKLNTDKPI